MIAYADTSFLVSLYVLDSNSTAAATRIKRLSLPLVLASFGEIELANAISLRQFRSEITASDAKSSYGLVSRDLLDGVLLIKRMPASAFEMAKRIARQQTPRLGTRTIDVLHVAAARSFQAKIFCTFDARQAKLAEAEGLALL